MTKDLFSAIKIGSAELKNRIIMAPMTRNRADDNLAPTDLMTKYYAQRASAGLIITEASQISAQGIGYVKTPGIHTDAQVEGWKKVTDAVHKKGGKIFIQLWHVGRVSHESLQPNGEKPVAPSAIKPDTQAFTADGPQDCPEPRALEIAEIKDIINDYVQATENAKKAGFDGVEIHAANGYLIDQFIRDGSNSREDDYGRDLEGRCKFAIDIVEAVTKAWEPSRVGIRLSPTSTFNDMRDSNPLKTFGYLTEKLNKYDLAYLHIVEPLPGHDMMDIQDGVERIAGDLKKLYNGNFMINGGYDKQYGQDAIKNGAANLVSFGVPFIANPDLVERFEKDAALNEPDNDTFYGGGAEGYTDYPTLDEKQKAA